MIIPVTAYLPLYRPLIIDESPERSARFRCNRQQFLESLPATFSHAWHEVRNVSLESVDLPEDIADALTAQSLLSNSRWTDHVVVYADIVLDIPALEAVNEPGSLTPEILNAFAAETLSDVIGRSLLLSELASPGCIGTLGGLAVAGDVRQSIREKSAYYSLFHASDSDATWPPLETIDINAVCDWAHSVGFDSEAFPKQRIGRALAAYTHVVGLGERREGESLFRAMQGLEAFYCDGIGDLRRQLAEKSEIWVGVRPDRQHSLGKLYEVRSRFEE